LYRSTIYSERTREVDVVDVVVRPNLVLAPHANIPYRDVAMRGEYGSKRRKWDAVPVGGIPNSKL
jgi:hypothetical protein